MISVSRTLPEDGRLDGATYVRGSLLETEALAKDLEGIDDVVIAVAPRGDMAGKTRGAIRSFIHALDPNTRVGVIGGSGGALIAPGGPRRFEQDFSEEFLAEAVEMSEVLDDMQALGTDHDWFLIHPAGNFGPWAEGERTGSYRTGGDVTVTDANGDSNISGADLGVATIDEIDDPKHHAQRFTVGY